MTTTRALVVGSGVNGLRSAIELLNKGIEVVLLSPHHFLHASTTSQGAGGYWMPFHCDDERVVKWASQTLDELLPRGNDTEDKLVEMLPAISLVDKNYTHPVNMLPKWTEDPRLNFQAMTTEMLHWQNLSIHRLRIPSLDTLKNAGYDYCWLYFSPVVDSPKMLQHMYEEVKMHPLTVHIDVETGHKFTSIDEMVTEAIKYKCDAIVNCTGMGSVEICKDDKLVGGRGVVLQYDRSCARREEIVSHEGVELMNDVVITSEYPQWGDETAPIYMIPRGNILVVGGSYLERDTEKKLRADERERLIKNANILGIDTKNAYPINEWAGFRPVRPIVRLEIDNGNSLAREKGITVVHNYGHGGSGWTVFIGAAKQVATLLGPRSKL